MCVCVYIYNIFEINFLNQLFVKFLYTFYRLKHLSGMCTIYLRAYSYVFNNAYGVLAHIKVLILI